MERRRRIILDTHVWIKLALGDVQTQKKFKDFLNGNYEKCLSIFSIWEFAMLVSKGRLLLNKDALTWAQESIKIAQLTLLPLSPEVAVASCFLPKKFHGDPADRIIYATSKLEGAKLLTEDKLLTKFIK